MHLPDDHEVMRFCSPGALRAGRAPEPAANAALSPVAAVQQSSIPLYGAVRRRVLRWPEVQVNAKVVRKFLRMSDIGSATDEVFFLWRGVQVSFYRDSSLQARGMPHELV